MSSSLLLDSRSTPKFEFYSYQFSIKICPGIIGTHFRFHVRGHPDMISDILGSFWTYPPTHLRFSPIPSYLPNIWYPILINLPPQTYICTSFYSSFIDDLKETIKNSLWGLIFKSKHHVITINYKYLKKHNTDTAWLAYIRLSSIDAMLPYINANPCNLCLLYSVENRCLEWQHLSLSYLEKGVVTQDANSLLSTINKMSRLYTIDATISDTK